MSLSMDTSAERNADSADTAQPTQAPQPSATRGRRGGPLRVRDFRLLMAGQMVSTVGDMFYAIALPWFILSSGGTAQDLGIVLAAYGIPRAGSVLLGGSLSDKLRPRNMMLIADIARAVLVGGLAALALLDIHTLWILCVIAVPLGAFEGIFLPASAAMLPSILHDDDLQAGNAINMATVQTSTLLGPGIGGVIVAAVRSGVAFAIDAITFLVSALSLAAMHGTRVQQAQQVITETAVTTDSVTEAPAAEAGDEPKTFWALFRQSRLLQTGLTVSIAANLAFGGLVEVALPDLAHGPLNVGSQGFGVMISAFGAGALVGSIIGGMLGRLTHRGLWGLLFGLGQGIFVGVTPFVGGIGGLGFVGIVGAIALWGIFNSMSNIQFITLIQQMLPKALMGRIMGAFMFANFGLYPISVAVGGLVVDRFGPAILFPITGGLLFLALLYGLFQPELRNA